MHLASPHRPVWVGLPHPHRATSLCPPASASAGCCPVINKHEMFIQISSSYIVSDIIVVYCNMGAAIIDAKSTTYPLGDVLFINPTKFVPQIIHILLHSILCVVQLFHKFVLDNHLTLWWKHLKWMNKNKKLRMIQPILQYDISE